MTGPAGAQSEDMLLRVLQEREVERAGASATLRTDVRVIAATNRDLARAIADGKFREDLFHRLNVFALVMPALRDRVGDIPLLVSYFMERQQAKLRRRSTQPFDFPSDSCPGASREAPW
jgi:transcriptional regulator with GAF, ATPase, and Fis domain